MKRRTKRSDSVSRWTPDASLGHVRAGESWDFSEDVVGYVNEKARSARLTSDEFHEFTPGSYFSVALPTEPLPKDEFMDLYQRLSVDFDGERKYRLADLPRFLSTKPDDESFYRGVPTFFPKSEFEEDWFGRPHTFQLFQDREPIAEPYTRTFHHESSGICHVELVDGHGELTSIGHANVASLQAREYVSPPFMFVVFSDPVFGVPSGATLVPAEGESRHLDVQRVGCDYIGDELAFNESVIKDIGSMPEEFEIRVQFPESGTGWCSIFSCDGHTKREAFRANATVR